MDAREVWKYVTGALIAVAIALHAIFPRFEWRTANAEGTAIVIYDRWGGMFQRAGWNEKGDVQSTQPFKPY